MNAISHFHTPVSFTGYKNNFTHRVIHSIEDYFYICGKKAYVIDGSGRSYTVNEQKRTHKCLPHCIYTALKIASYMTVFIPLIMLAAKVIVRMRCKFTPGEPKIVPLPFLGLSLTQPPLQPHPNDVYVYGDVHGALRPFKEELYYGGIVDGFGNWKKGVVCTALQMGDLVDRGPKSAEAVDYVFEQQEKARNEGGNLIVLAGNHEIWMLQGTFVDQKITNPAAVALKLRLKVLSGDMKLAHCYKNRLYTHAGLRTKIRKQLIMEIVKKKSCSITAVTLHDIADHLNELLIHAVQTNDFSHSVFQVGTSRGGQHDVGGVVWEDVDKIMNSVNALQIPQGIAHNPPIKGKRPIVQITDSMRLLNTDVGRCAHYGGNQGFVIVRDDKIYRYELDNNSWQVDVLTDPFANHPSTVNVLSGIVPRSTT